MSTDPDGFSSSLVHAGSGRAAGPRPRCRPGSRPGRRSTSSRRRRPAPVPVPPRVARVARWRAEDPPAQELSTLTMPALRSPARREEGLAPDASLVEQAAGGGVAEDHQVDVGRVDAGVGQGVGHHLVGHVLGGAVPPVHGGDGRCPRCVRCGPWCPRYPRARSDAGQAGGQGGHQALELSNGWSAVTYTATCSAPASR